jgi:hypothetical protein
MAEKREAVVRSWPRYMTKQWRDRGTLRHFVMVIDDDGEEMVLSKWWSRKRGWQYECERFEMVRMQISILSE